MDLNQKANSKSKFGIPIPHWAFLCSVCDVHLVFLSVPTIQSVHVRLGPRPKDIKPAGQMVGDDQVWSCFSQFSNWPGIIFHVIISKAVFPGIFQSLYYLRHKMWDEGGMKEALTRIPSSQYLFFAFLGSNQKFKLTPWKSLLSTFEDKMVATFSNLGRGPNEQKTAAKPILRLALAARNIKGSSSGPRGLPRPSPRSI